MPTEIIYEPNTRKEDEKSAQIACSDTSSTEVNAYYASSMAVDRGTIDTRSLQEGHYHGDMKDVWDRARTQSGRHPPTFLCIRKPSEYIQEMTMDTQERLSRLLHSTHVPDIVELVGAEDVSQKNYAVPLDKPLFEPFPKEIVFQGYSAFKVYEVVISFRNNDHVSVCEIDQPSRQTDGNVTSLLVGYK
jgi:hypothetical protein